MLQLSEKTLGDWLEHWAEVTPDKEYIVYSDRNLYNPQIEMFARFKMKSSFHKTKRII